MTNPYLQAIKSKTSVPSRMTSGQWAAVKPEARAEMFFSATVEDAYLLDGIRQMVETGIAEGWNETTFVRNMRQWMRETTDAATGKPYLGAEERKTWTQEERNSYERSVRHIDSMARLKLIFRTQMDSAVGSSFWQAEMRPDRLNAAPAFRFIRRPGAVTKRLDHVAHEDDVRLKTDLDYWIARNNPDFGGFGVPWPPYGYNSWMDLEPVERKSCVGLGLLKESEKPEMPAQVRAKWGLPRAIAAANSERSVKRLSDAQRTALMAYLDKRGIVVRYDEARGVIVRDAAIETAAKVAAVLTPEKFIESCGLAMNKPAKIDEIKGMLEKLGTRHPENREKFGEIITSVTSATRGKDANAAAVKKIEDGLKDLFAMCDPEVLSRIPQITITQKAMRGLGGYYSPLDHSIRYNAECSKQTIFHEFVHALHFHGSPETREELSTYFADRTKGNKYGKLEWGGEGKRDSWAPTFDPVDDYAGRIYDNCFRLLDKNGILTHVDDFAEYPAGAEMATRHLERLALPPEKFLKYWNDQKRGKYLWRECFVKCLQLFFE